MKNQSFCFLKKDDKSTCFKLHFDPCGFANDFLNRCYSGCTWFFWSCSLRNNTTNSTACTCRNCGVTRVCETCGVACICHTCGVACLCSNCDLACIRNRVSQCQIRFCEFVSVCILLLSSLSLWVDSVWWYQGRIFFLILFCNVLQSCFIASTSITHVII